MKSRYCAVFAAALFASAPVAWAHGGQEHRAPEHHEAAIPAQRAANPSEPLTDTLVRENSALRLEVERLKAESAMIAADGEREKTKFRATFAVGGILLIAAGLFLRYVPGRGRDEN